MSKPIRITTPLSGEDVERLQAGDEVLISGVVLGARDAAHQRLFELIQAGQRLPVDLEGQVIYYVGPTPPRPGAVIGAAGPTTAGRMDPYTPALLARGLKGMIGKGTRAREVIEALRKYRGVYFAGIGGAAALLAKHIKAAEVIAYPDLATEAIRRLVLEDFPAIVANDCHGGDAYRDAREVYRRERELTG